MDGPRRKKAWKNKGADQHAFPRILNSAFVFDSGKNNDETCYMQKVTIQARHCSSPGRFEPYLVANPGDRVSRIETQKMCRFTSLVFNP